MVRLEEVSLRYASAGRPGPEVLRGVTCDIPAGGFRWLLGPSGAGKSSLLRLLHLAVRPTSGRLRLLETDIGRAGRRELPELRRHIGMVFQDFRLLPHLSAFDNAALPLRIAGRSERRIRTDVAEMLRWVGLGERLGARPAELSGGEQQRVAIARAVVGRPSLLLADEPTGNLDEAQAERLMVLLKEMNRLGVTVVVASHNDALVGRHPGPVLRLEHGRLVEDGWAETPRVRDTLGLRRALGDRMLPLQVGAMAFLAALALAGSVGAAALAGHWQGGAAAAMTVQVPDPTLPAAAGGGNRLAAVLAVLRQTPDIAEARPLSDAELADLLRPWLGGAATPSLPLPAVVAVHMTGQGPDPAALGARLMAAAPGTLAESHGIWVGRLSALARSLQACASVAVAVVALVAAAVIAVATRAGLGARREAIEIVHGLGATDGYIAGRFARRATALAALGAAAGGVAALPVLLGLARLAAPFAAASGAAGEVVAPGGGSTLAGWPMVGWPMGGWPVGGWLDALPPVLWMALPGLPVAAAVIGFVTAQGTVRGWLRRLP